jgi:hypothetical protein
MRNRGFRGEKVGFLESAGRRLGKRGPSLPSFLFVLLFFLLGASISRAQDGAARGSGALSASLDRDSAGVGSVVVLTLSYRLPEGARLPEKLQIRGLEGLSVTDVSTGPGRIKVSLLLDRLGQLKSGSISLAYLDREGNPQTLNTGPLSITVLSNLGDKAAEAELRSIQDIVPARSPWLKILPWGGGLIGLLLAAGGLFWWLRKRRAGRGLQVLEGHPHIRALKEIEHLEARKLFETGQVRAFYFALSEILRRYLESVRHFPAAEFTTEEISHHLRDDQDRLLLPLLRQADLVKFADTVPTHARKEEDVRTALSYIRETSPFPENDRGGEMARGVRP